MTSRLLKLCALAVLALAAAITQLSLAQTPPTLEEMKGEADRATDGRQARLCAELAAHLVDIASEQFSHGNMQQGQATVQDVLNYGSKAHSVALNSKASMKDIKDTELALRKAERSLGELKRTLSVADRAPLDGVEKKLDEFRQDLLNVLFAPKKKN